MSTGSVPSWSATLTVPLANVQLATAELVTAPMQPPGVP